MHLLAILSALYKSLQNSFAEEYKAVVLKVVLGVALLFIVLVGAIYLYGASLPREHAYSRVAVVKASPEILYDLAIDAQSQSSWRRDVPKITMHAGQKSWIEHTNQGDVSFDITTEERPHTFSLKFQGQGFEGTWKGAFVAVDSGTEVSLREVIAIQNPFFRVLSKVMKFTETFMDRYIHDLKTEAEKRYNG
jgi:hypothetical protein